MEDRTVCVLREFLVLNPFYDFTSLNAGMCQDGCDLCAYAEEVVQDEQLLKCRHAHSL